MSAIDVVLAGTTAVFAVATWVLPPANYMLSFRCKPKSSSPSLAAFARAIGLVLFSACLSLVTLILAILTLAFSDRTGWGWFGLGAIGAYWPRSRYALLGTRKWIEERTDQP